MANVIYADLIPTPGKWVDSCGIFGLERTENGLLRATAFGQSSKWAVELDAAEELVALYMPDSQEIASGVSSGDASLVAQARSKALQFPELWDKNAQDSMLNCLFHELRCPSVQIALGTLRVTPAPDGLFYLECSTGQRSKVGATTWVAAGVMEAWEGIPPAAALACEDPMTGVTFVRELSEVAEQLIARWDAECPAHAAAKEQMDTIDRETEWFEPEAIIECVSALDDPSAQEAMAAVERLYD